MERDRLIIEIYKKLILSQMMILEREITTLFLKKNYL